MTHRLTIRYVQIVFAACLMVALAACGGEDNALGDAPEPTASATAPATNPTPTPPATVPRENLPAPVELAIEVAASDAGVPPEQVGLLGYTEERWNDTSLGCPKPDGVYAQVITPGYNVRLLVNGQEREYHTDMGDTVVRCNVVVQ